MLGSVVQVSSSVRTLWLLSSAPMNHRVGTSKETNTRKERTKGGVIEKAERRLEGRQVAATGRQEWRGDIELCRKEEW